MEEADQIERTTDVIRNAITEHDAQKLGALSIDIVDSAISQAGLDPEMPISYGDETKTTREYILYLVTKILLRGHVEAGEIEAVPADFDLQSAAGAVVVNTLAQRNSAEEN